MHRRPTSVSIMGGFLSIGCVYGFFSALHVVFMNDDPLFKQADDGSTMPAGVLQLLPLIYALIGFVSAVNILDGANWARWLYTISSVFQFGADMYFNPHFSISQWVSVGFRVAMITFMFLPAANDFFKEPN